MTAYFVGPGGDVHLARVECPGACRPVVVIDPEDREAVERLGDIFCAAPSSGWVEQMQAALREYASPPPPKPEEPTGLGSVVEDAEGRRWVLLPPHVKYHRWACWGEPLNDRPWSSISAVRVLSEGVPEDGAR